MRYKLKKPVKGLDGSDLTEIKLKDEPTVADLLFVAAQKPATPVEQNVVTIARLAGLDRVEIERLGIADYTALCGLLDGVDPEGKSPAGTT